ncbi:MAG: glycosyltransferase family 39 protein [Chloroflexi bacterium]|nr:glycosyltransferase family 39 protein [Chloroflexota bacterium]
MGLLSLLRTKLRRADWALAAILLLGAVLRLWAISFGLPYMYHPDEGVAVNIALRVLHTGNFSPEFFNWPSLLFYLNALVYFAYYLLGRLMGAFTSPSDLPYPVVEIMAVGKAALPAEFLLGRGLTAIVGTLSVVWVYLVCRQLFGSRTAGWLAAVWLAAESISVKHSQFIRPDTFAIFFALWTAYFALRILERPTLGNYLLAGIGGGLAVSSKYNLVFALVPVLVAHVIYFRSQALWRREIYVAAGVSVLAFFLTTPFALLDWPRFWQIGPLQDAQIYSTGHPGAEGNTFPFYVSFLWSTQGWVAVLAALEAIWIVFRRPNKKIVLASFPFVYFGFINLFTVRSEATILPIIPFLIVMAVGLVSELHDSATRRFSVPHGFANAAFIGIGIFLSLPLLRASVGNNALILQWDGREYARQWIETNLPYGARIALEAYSPYVERDRFMVDGFYGLQDHAPDWYVSNGYEYLIFSQGIFGRYLADAERYPDEVSRYRTLFSRFENIARFDQNGFTILISKTGTALPPHRVAARFGDAGDLVELVGYDASAARWIPGEPLHVQLYWRTLRDQNEPLQVSLTVARNDGRAAGVVEGDLFQGKGWPAGMFVTEWSIPTFREASPGLHDLQVHVTQTRYGYRTPIQKWNGDKIEELTLGPFKLSAPPVSPGEVQTMRATEARWADQLALVGYAPLEKQARAGDVLPLSFYWKPLSESKGDYTFFVHLLDGEGKLRAQIDMRPRGGAYPTSIWDAGQVLRDDYELRLPNDLAPGDYRLEIGWYEFPSLKRLAVGDDNSWVLAETVEVVR